MSHIEKEKLIKADIASIENRVRHAFNQGYDLGFKDGKASSRTSSTTKNDLEVLRDTLVGRAILDGFKQGVDSIRAMTSVNPQELKWIPVSERFPEENGGYLVTVKRGYVMNALWVGIAEHWNEVIAWMPLPKPYKGESEPQESEVNNG